MKWLALAAVFSVCAFAQPPGVRTVYILSMPGGFDQYLANWLTAEHVLDVVTDPKAADAILTDRLGEVFERKMAQILPREEDDEADASKPTFRSSVNQGTVFLVHAGSRKVLWSDYEKPSHVYSAAKLSDAARKIVTKMQRAFPR